MDPYISGTLSMHLPRVVTARARGAPPDTDTPRCDFELLLIQHLVFVPKAPVAKQSSARLGLGKDCQSGRPGLTTSATRRFTNQSPKKRLKHHRLMGSGPIVPGRHPSPRW